MSGINGYAQRGDVSKKIHKEQQEITTTLSALTSEQLGGIEEIYKTHESNVLNAFSSGNRSSIKLKIEALRDRKDAQMKNVLTDEQYVSYLELVSKYNSGRPW